MQKMWCTLPDMWQMLIQVHVAPTEARAHCTWCWRSVEQHFPTPHALEQA